MSSMIGVSSRISIFPGLRRTEGEEEILDFGFWILDFGFWIGRELRAGERIISLSVIQNHFHHAAVVAVIPERLDL